MRHFTIVDWADYVRGVGATATLTEMQAHLLKGCERCQTDAAALDLVATTAEIDGAVTPPAGAVRSVKAYGATQDPATRGFSGELLLHPTFDSAAAPAPAGSRTRAPSIGRCSSRRTAPPSS